MDAASASCPSGPADFVITAPNRILKKSGGPIQLAAADMPGCSGGTFAWTTTSTKITLSSASGATITVQGLAQVSASRDAEVITVTRTQTGVAPVTKTVNVTVAEVTFSRATTQRYGFDDFDTPADHTDDHVSIKKSDYTFVHVDITGGALGNDFDFVCDDTTICTAVAPGATASFDLRLDAGAKNKDTTPLHAKVRSPTRESFAAIAVNVYNEKAVPVVVAKIVDSTNATTNLHYPGLDPGAHTATVNDKLKEAVVHFNITNYAASGGTTDVRFDLDNNGALSFDINGGGGAELAAIGSAMTGTGTSTRVIVVKALRSYYYLRTAVGIGDTTLQIRGSNVFSYGSFPNVPLGLGADREMVTVSSVAGTTITLAAGVTKAHAIGAPIEFIAAGWSSNPIIMTEENSVDNSTIAQNVILWTIPHEVGHQILTLADINDQTNFMHHQQSWTDYRLRYCPRTLHYSAGTENQWEKIPR